jgi:hypothetical protein
VHDCAPREPLVKSVAPLASTARSRRGIEAHRAAPAGRAFDYQRQVELIMNAPLRDARAATTRKERLAAGAVLLAIAVSVCGACVVIVESSSEPPPARASAAAAR